MKVALIGLPQAGKRTLFSLLTGRPAPANLRPGETPEGTALVRDPRVDVLSGICQPQKTTYAATQIALCPDVNEGAARDWIDPARRCELLVLVVREFASDAVYHPAGSVDGNRDLLAIRSELLLADMEMCEKRLERLAKEKRAGQTPEKAREESVLVTCMAALEEERPLSELDLPAHEMAAIANLGLVTFLPQLVVHNVSEEALATDMPADELAVSCLIEQEIMTIADDNERREYLASLGLEAAGIDRVNTAAYDALGLMSYYTVGPDEVRAWTIRKGSSAPVAGGKIHSDIERGFIRVEVIKYDHFVDAGSEKAAKDGGKTQLKGKDYIMEDGDICHFLFNV